MIKRLVYLGSGLLALISTFLTYSVVGLKFVDGVPAVAQEAVKAAASANKGLLVTFFEYIGDFADNSVNGIFQRLLVFLAIICAVVVFVAGAIALIRKDDKILEIIPLKWINVCGLVAVILALVVSLFVPPLVPDTLKANGVSKLVGNIGVGAILFIVAMAVATLISFLYKTKKATK